MLKAKKQALAAQVLLGLMMAGNAYAADFSVEGVENSDPNANQVVGNTFYASGYSIPEHINLIG